MIDILLIEQSLGELIAAPVAGLCAFGRWTDRPFDFFLHGHHDGQ
jgi:hypothetical protein